MRKSYRFHHKQKDCDRQIRRHLHSGDRLGWNSFNKDLMLESSPATNVNSPVDLLRFGSGHFSASTMTVGGGRTGGSLYISFFCVTRRNRYSDEFFGNPSSFEFWIFLAVFDFASLSAVFFHFSSNSEELSMTLFQDAVESELSVRLCLLNAFIDFVRYFPILEYSNNAIVIVNSFNSSSRSMHASTSGTPGCSIISFESRVAKCTASCSLVPMAFYRFFQERREVDGKSQTWDLWQVTVIAMFTADKCVPIRRNKQISFDSCGNSCRVLSCIMFYWACSHHGMWWFPNSYSYFVLSKFVRWLTLCWREVCEHRRVNFGCVIAVFQESYVGT